MPGPGQVAVMLESLDTVVVPERCLAPVSSLHEVKAEQVIRQFDGFGADGSRRDRSYTAKHGGGLTAATSNHTDHLAHAKSAMKSLEAMKFAPQVLRRRPSSASSRRGSIHG